MTASFVYACGWVTGGFSNSPKRNIGTKMWRSIPSSRAIGTFPSDTACLSGSPKYCGGAACISMSMPAIAESTVLCVAPQSEVTKPVKPQSRRR